AKGCTYFVYYLDACKKQFPSETVSNLYVRFQKYAKVHDDLFKAWFRISQQTSDLYMQFNQVFEVFDLHLDNIKKLDRVALKMMINQIKELASDEAVVKRDPTLEHGAFQFLQTCGAYQEILVRVNSVLGEKNRIY